MSPADRELLKRLGLSRGEVSTLAELKLARRLDQVERRLREIEQRPPSLADRGRQALARVMGFA